VFESWQSFCEMTDDDDDDDDDAETGVK